MSVFVALAVAALQRRCSPRAAASAAAVFLPIMLREWFVVGFPLGKPQPFEVAAIYRVPELQQARALVSLPDYRGTLHGDRYGAGATDVVREATQMQEYVLVARVGSDYLFRVKD
jgi:hypothetical protein